MPESFRRRDFGLKSLPVHVLEGLIFVSFSAHPPALDDAARALAEAAGAQGAFWPMHDLLLSDQARLEDPHLWDRARALGLDLERFDVDRRSELTIERITRNFRAGVRAGVVTTPTIFRWTAAGAERVDPAELTARSGGD